MITKIIILYTQLKILGYKGDWEKLKTLNRKQLSNLHSELTQFLTIYQNKKQ
jgi:hypothetical protein